MSIGIRQCHRSDVLVQSDERFLEDHQLPQRRHALVDEAQAERL